MVAFISSFLASVGFAILFNIRKRKILIAGLVGGIGGLTYSILLIVGKSTFLALFVASIVISLSSEICARRFKTPSTTFLVCALIPLVPGGGMYYTMLEIVQDNLNGALVRGIDTVAQACSIAVGCILVSSLMKMYNKYMVRG